MCDDQRRALRAGDHIGNREGFAGTGNAQKNLMLLACGEPPGQFVNGLRLIAAWNKIRNE